MTRLSVVSMSVLSELCLYLKEGVKGLDKIMLRSRRLYEICKDIQKLKNNE